jgi:TP901 family phage tail tape measure protein
MGDTANVTITANWRGGADTKAARKELERLAKEADKLEKSLNKLHKSASKANNSLSGVGSGASLPSASVNDPAQGASRFGSTMTSVGGMLGGAVASGLVAAAAGVAAFSVASVQAGIEFESSFAGVTKTVDGLTDELGNLTAEGEAMRGEFRDLGKTIPVSVNALAGIGELGGQLGVAQSDLIAFTETIAKVSVATNLTEESAATSFAQIANVMGSTQDDVERFASTVVDLGNNSATTESQIVNFASRIAGAGAIAGLSESDIAAIAASFSSVGVEAEAGGTAVQASLIAINDAVATGGEDLEIFAATAGLTVDEFSTLWRQDAAGAFTAFVEGLGQQGDLASSTLNEVGLGGARSTRAFLSLANAGPLLADSIGLANDAFAENVALTNEAAQRFSTTESKIQLLSNKFNDLKITTGDNLSPAIDTLIGSLDRLLDKMSAIAESDSFAQLFEDFATGVSYVTGEMNDQTLELVKNNADTAQSISELETEFDRLVGIADELRAIDPFADNLTQDSTAEIVRRVAEVSESYAEFERTLDSLNMAAMDAGEVGSFNVYDVAGFRQEWEGYYTTIQEGARQARMEVEALTFASAGNDFELNDREMSGASYGDDRGYQIMATDLAAVAGQAPLTAAELEKLAKTRLKWELDAYTASVRLYEDLELAQQDLIDAQGEYVTVYADNSYEIARINQQLASDLTSEQVDAFEEILGTVEEGSAEWLNAYNALQSDLTDSTREGLVARRAELEGADGAMSTAYTGDAEAAEEAQARIEEANQAIITSYRETVFEALLAQTGVTEGTLALGVELGLLTEEQAAARLEFSETTAALQELAASDTFASLTLTDQLEAVNLITLGYADSAGEALSLAGVIDGNLSSSVRNATEATVELDKMLAELEGTTTSTVDIVVNGLDALREAKLLKEGIKDVESSATGQVSGALASGGPARAGDTYLVGEQGPELFVPERNGYVMNAQDTARVLGGGQSATLSIGQIVIQAGGDADTQAIATAVREQIERQANELGNLIRAGGGWTS